MKGSALFVTAIFFFILVNTTYYWEGNLGSFAILVFGVFVIIYFVLAISFFRQAYLTGKERFSDKKRVMLTAVLATVLSVTFFKPDGIIDFSKFESADVLVGQREGSANCLTTFRLKQNKKFTKKVFCFGATESEGTYRLVNDTIYFENVNPDRQGNKFYQYALVRPSVFLKDNQHFDLVCFTDQSDTTGFNLLIVKNELSKLSD